MDRFTRNYLIGLCTIAALGLLYFLGSSDPRVDTLNELLEADPQLAAYPYTFQVLELENGVAVMSSPRSAEVSVIQFLRAAFPELSNSPVTAPQMMAAQDQLAALQSRAAELVRDQDDVRAVRWQLDRRWFEARGVYLP